MPAEKLAPKGRARRGGLQGPSRLRPVETERSFPGSIAVYGLTGVGKSAFCTRASEDTGTPVYDNDSWTVKRMGMSIEEAVKKHGGWDYFRAEEAKSVKEIAEIPGNKILSLGGGALMNEDTRRILQEAGVTGVYLTAPIPTIVGRIMNDPGPVRPDLEKEKGPEAIARVLEGRLNDRGGVYQEFADVTLDTDAKDVATVVREGLQKVKEFKAAQNSSRKVDKTRLI